MSRRAVLISCASVAVIAAVVFGLATRDHTESSQTERVLTANEVQRALVGSPPRLAALHKRANTLVEASPASVERQIRRLRGTPVVLNMWGSWCPPCRGEMPLFQRANATFGKRVAFLGLDAKDSNSDAAAFLTKVPVGYPSFIDGDGDAVQRLAAAVGLPTTVFYDKSGRQQIHQGPYSTQADLNRDIRRYASD